MAWVSYGRYRLLLSHLRRVLALVVTIIRRAVAFNQDHNYRLDMAELEQALAATH